ncbi:M20/M25/M40 family metallo-hydrolase [Roseiterribacter gracilis]|uniref:Peptidase M20 n=1 Tax=Roseiterribacter gracilis TaxID=2812848 RepID=A0A8S8XC59_9PROT|nr:peptidase M20 [Rhodospirillales bacterium TMPK1]
MKFAFGLLAATIAVPAAAADDLTNFRALYKELVEINTTLSVGSCTDAAKAMQARLKAAGYSDKDMLLVVPPGMPKKGNLVAVLHGTDKAAKAILLLAHIDVVEAKRADWKRDPFKLTEENGMFYGRGASDDKAMAAVFTDNMIRYKKEGLKPKRDIKLALTCGEETPHDFDGAQYLAEKHRPWVEAEFALNEGAGGRLDKDGKHLALDIQAGEKIYQDFQLEATGPGGHSSRPTKGNNPLYHVAAALSRIEAYEFPVAINAVTKANFEKTALVDKPNADDLKAAAATADAEAVARVARDPSRNSMMRTTCVATQIEGGHAPNALPQRTRANVNCRVLPGVPMEEIRQQLIKVIADPTVEVTAIGAPGFNAPVPALTPKILGPATQVAAKLWPDVPLIPAMSTGATDGRYLNEAGIPTVGLSGMFHGPEGAGAHGLDEHIRVQSLYDGREFLYQVVKLYADQAS